MKQLLCFVSLLLASFSAHIIYIHTFSKKTISSRWENLDAVALFEPAKIHLLINNFSYVLHLNRPLPRNLYVGDILSFRDQGEKAFLMNRKGRQIPCFRVPGYFDT